MKKRYLLIAAAVLLAVVWLYWGNTALMVTEITIESLHIPSEFSGFRIVQISDLHNTEFGKDNEKLLSLLADTQPDMIVLTGDLVDSRNTDIPAALGFVEQATAIAPCYYVTGNHEGRLPEPQLLLQALEQAGVVVLRKETVTVHRDTAAITLLGVDDPSFTTDYLLGDSETVMRENLQELSGQDGYTILLSHRPELLDAYAEAGIDLVFSGHAHGGQIRLPLVGGLIAPNQGIFPKYDSGLYRSGNTCMIVSRGVGNSLLPLRINNRPEIVVAQLESA